MAYNIYIIDKYEIHTCNARNDYDQSDNRLVQRVTIVVVVVVVVGLPTAY